ncbi:MAG TPA: S9 family peptidase [Steroidobacteraceae bacterium]|nr:S9 family peptidase [Steroidobacteraceae bacterium]
MRGETRVDRRCLRAHAASALLLVFLLAGPCRSEATDLSVYGRLPSIENVVISGDGSRLAFLRTEGDDRVVTIYGVSDHKFLRGLKVGQQKARWIEWADPDHLLITLSATTVPAGFFGDVDEWYQTQIYDVRDGSLTVVPQYDALNGIDVMTAVFGRPVIRHLDGHTVLFLRTLQLSNHQNLALARVDVQTHATRVVRPGKDNNYDWIVDSTGEIVAEESYNEHTRHWSISIPQNGHAKEIASGQENIEFPGLVGFGSEPGTVLLEQIENGDPVWRAVSLKDGSIGAPVAERDRFEEPIEDPRTYRMIGGLHEGDFQEVTFLDTVTRYGWEMVVGAFPGERVELASHSDDFRKFVVQVQGREKGYRFVLVDLDTHKATPLGEIYAGVKPLEVRRVVYAAADGTQIPAYLTLPNGRPAQNLPLIVMPHGGPAVRDTAEFDWWSQALASLGYAVLRPNYRGSTLGWEFLSKGFGEWGRKMQTDLSDGVRYLAKEGVVDPKRVCIVGASYGGYAALAGASLDPGVYQCAVSVGGISDLRLMLHWENERAEVRNGLTLRYWDRFMGAKGPDDPLLNTISPIRHLDAIQVPILLIHGKDDTVVDYQQSQAMYDALRGAHKEAQFVTLKREDHWLSRSETRLQMLEATSAFLLAHNPPN